MLDFGRGGRFSLSPSPQTCTTMTYKDRNDMIKDLCAGTLELDKLQVELSADSPYKTPSAEESRARILKAMDKLQSVYNLLENQKCED